MPSAITRFFHGSLLCRFRLRCDDPQLRHQFSGPKAIDSQIRQRKCDLRAEPLQVTPELQGGDIFWEQIRVSPGARSVLEDSVFCFAGNIGLPF
jgi:hypothetical protein